MCSTWIPFNSLPNLVTGTYLSWQYAQGIIYKQCDCGILWNGTVNHHGTVATRLHTIHVCKVLHMLQIKGEVSDSKLKVWHAFGGWFQRYLMSCSSWLKTFSVEHPLQITDHCLACENHNGFHSCSKEHGQKLKGGVPVEPPEITVIFLQRIRQFLANVTRRLKTSAVLQSRKGGVAGRRLMRINKWLTATAENHLHRNHFPRSPTLFSVKSGNAINDMTASGEDPSSPRIAW